MPPFHSRSTGARRIAEISSSGDRASDRGVEAERGPGLRGDRHRLRRPGPDAAAGGDQRRVVVRPRRAGQVEQPLPLGEADRRVRVRVEEHVAVIERGDQLQVPGQQHPVAEHVTGHVADADGREVVGVRVQPQRREVPADRLPGAAGGDAHLLVVVALGAARGERVAEPVAVPDGDLVGHVGERRGPLVGGDDQVRVVPVEPDHAGRRHHGVADDVVGDVEHRADERPVAGEHLRLVGVPVGRVGQLLADEPALRAGRDDDRVLHLLRLDQAEHLGAEVLGPFRPAQAAARDRAEPQVHRLKPGRVDPDLELRPRRGDHGHPLGGELEHQVRRGLAVVLVLEVVRAQGGLDQGQVGAEDAVVVEADHLVERAAQFLGDRRAALLRAVLRAPGRTGTRTAGPAAG